MKTPITDAGTFDPYPWNQNGPGRSHRPEVMYPCDDGAWVSADTARRLELDRAELMDALCEIHILSHDYSGEGSIALKAIESARANFPTE